MRKRHSGFTLVEIMIVIAIIGLIAAIAIPNFVRARRTSQGQACAQQLEQIEGAKQQWGFENNANDTASATTADLAPYLKLGVFPSCPASGTYGLNALDTQTTCDLATGTSGFHELNQF